MTFVNKNIENTLEQIELYFHSNYRQTGRTTALINLCKERDFIFIAQNEDHKRQLISHFHGAVPIMCVSQFKTALRGHRKPIIVDHYVMESWIRDLVSGISDLGAKVMSIYMAFLALETENKRLKETIGSLGEYAKKQKRIKKIYRELAEHNVEKALKYEIMRDKFNIVKKIVKWVRCKIHGRRQS